VKVRDVMGKVDAFGWPARREIRPGRDSSGIRDRTEECVGGLVRKLEISG
jgi:hypothetical protein